MKIGIDARWIFAVLSGIGAYTRELIRQLALQDRGNEYVLFFDDENRMNEVMAGTGGQGTALFAARLSGDESRLELGGLGTVEAASERFEGDRHGGRWGAA